MKTEHSSVGDGNWYSIEAKIIDELIIIYGKAFTQNTQYHFNYSFHVCCKHLIEFIGKLYANLLLHG